MFFFYRSNLTFVYNFTAAWAVEQYQTQLLKSPKMLATGGATESSYANVYLFDFTN